MQQQFIALTGIVVASMMPGHCCGQEHDPKDPVVIADGISRADVVVIGTFELNYSLPWFNGWHRNGTLRVETVLHGNAKVGDALQYRWLEPFLPASHSCQNVSSWFQRTKGIWFLKQKGNDWSLSGTKAVWCGGPLPLEAREAVQKVIDSRR
jgi:hypothetical protein